MAVKYVFVTGGVVSGLGKGITAASLGRLLKARGYKVTMQKFDPYINIDPGTMNPIQHGEVFVTEDGTETDLDLGHYERFIDVTFILDGRAEEKKTSAFTFSQEIIDAILANGSGFSEGKMRIYEQFEKSLSAKENADFLKNEYGWGGSYPVIIGAGIDESHDGKGITITKGIGKENPHITLSWSQVEKRIGELIRMDRYLNPKEKERYPQWLESQEEHRAKIEETKRNREILSNALPEQELAEKEPEEAEISQDVKYEYHLGDKVYILSLIHIWQYFYCNQH